MRLILFQRDECPLCDHALAVLAAASAPEFESVWIDDDPALELRYGTRVPVLHDADSTREIDGPLEPETVRRWLDDLP